MSMEKRSTALVIKSTGSWYALRDVRSGRPLAGRIRGSLRLRGSRSTNPVVVGDRVEYETADDGTAAIVGVCPRSNYIIRRSPNLSKESHIIAANVDQAVPPGHEQRVHRPLSGDGRGVSRTGDARAQ